MKTLRAQGRLTCAILLAAALSNATAARQPNLLRAQTPAASSSTELEELLFVQAPESSNIPGSIVVIWLPPPLQKLCLGRTAKQCATIDYCIRTTNREAAMCRNIGVNLAQIPRYPSGTRPARMISITLSYLQPTRFELLQRFYRDAPPSSLEHISMSARVKARIRFTRKPNDDDFELLDVLAVPPL